MFNPTALDPLIKGLRSDAADLRAHRRKLVERVEALPWSGPRGERYRRQIKERADSYEKRAKELERIADRMAALKRDVETELRYLREVQEKFEDLLRSARDALGQALGAARDAVEGAEKVLEAGVNVVTGDFDEAKRDWNRAQSEFDDAIGALQRMEERHRYPTCDPRWREADDEARHRSGGSAVGGAAYRAPHRPAGR